MSRGWLTRAQTGLQSPGLVPAGCHPAPPTHAAAFGGGPDVSQTAITLQPVTGRPRVCPGGPPTAVSLFAGAGGLDVGIERAGFEVVTATDVDEDCVETLRANKERGIPVADCTGHAHLAETLLIRAPVEELVAADLTPAGATSRWRPDLLTGGPPCQPFSSAGRQRSVADPRGRLFEDFVRLAALLRPRFVLFVNVRGLVTARGPSGRPGEALALVRDAFEGIGFSTTFALLNAADYGAPQRRVRLFMLATAAGELPGFPDATHSREPPSPDLFGAQRKPWVTLGEFLAAQPSPSLDEIVRPSPQLAEGLAALPDGRGVRSPGRPEPTRPGGHWGYRQGTFIADPALPARTVTAAVTQDWVRAPDATLRRLTLRECAGLQGFPQAWELCGNTASRFRQVGNAVPAVFGEVLGRSLLDVLSEGRQRRRSASAPFPEYMTAAIEYTRREDHRNGSARPRSPRFSEA